MWPYDMIHRGIFTYDVLHTPPAPMNHVKYLRAGPAEMPFRTWYTANTNHFCLTDFRWKSRIQLCWVINPVQHNLVRRIRFWTTKSPEQDFQKKATKYKSLLRKLTYKDKKSYEFSPPCIVQSRDFVLRDMTQPYVTWLLTLRTLKVATISYVSCFQCLEGRGRASTSQSRHIRKSRVIIPTNVSSHTPKSCPKKSCHMTRHFAFVMRFFQMWHISRVCDEILSNATYIFEGGIKIRAK